MTAALVPAVTRLIKQQTARPIDLEIDAMITSAVLIEVLMVSTIILSRPLML